MVRPNTPDWLLVAAAAAFTPFWTDISVTIGFFIIFIIFFFFLSRVIYRRKVITPPIIMYNNNNNRFRSLSMRRQKGKHTNSRFIFFQHTFVYNNNNNMANENHYNMYYTYTPHTATVKNIFVRVLFTTIVLYFSTAVSMDFFFYSFDKRLSFVVLYYIIRSVEVRVCDDRKWSEKNNKSYNGTSIKQ